MVNKSAIFSLIKEHFDELKEHFDELADVKEFRSEIVEWGTLPNYSFYIIGKGGYRYDLFHFSFPQLPNTALFPVTFNLRSGLKRAESEEEIRNLISADILCFYEYSSMRTAGGLPSTKN